MGAYGSIWNGRLIFCEYKCEPIVCGGHDELCDALYEFKKIDGLYYNQGPGRTITCGEIY